MNIEGPAPDPSSLDGFLRLAAHGYHLAPIRIRRGPDGRKRTTYFRERGAGWGEAATTDPDQITRWWRRYGPDCGFLIACVPSELVVIDLDLKPAAEVDAVSWWAREGLPIGSMRVDTPSGGQHLYFRQRKTDPIPNSTGAIAPGVDIRGSGGQFGGLVHAPGTRVLDGDPGEVYRLLDALVAVEELDEIPDEVVELIPLERRRRREKATGGAGGRAHQLSWIEGEVIRLGDKVREMPAREGTGFRYALMGASMMAGRLMVAKGDDRSRPEEYLREAVRHVWGSVSAEDEEWIQTGLDDGEADPYTIEPEDDEAVTPESDPDAYQVALDREIQRQRLQHDAREALAAERRPPRPAFASLVTTDADLASVPLPRMAIATLLPDRAVGWLGGPSGTYKSFVAVDLALALGYGGHALDDDTLTVARTCPVLYVAGEDFSGVALRVRAGRHARGITATGRVHVYERAADLTDDRQLEEIIAYAREHGIGHVIVDTFRQSTIGVNENDNTEVGVILGRMLRLRDECGIGSTLIDHTNKSASGLADLGGAGAKRANADYVLMIDLPNGDRSVGQQRMLRMAKLKSGPDGRTWPIRLRPVPEVADEDGQESAVAVVGALPVEAMDMHGDDDWMTVTLPDDVRDHDGAGRDALGVVARLVMHYGARDSGVSRAEIVSYYRAQHPGTSPDSAKKRVNRAWDALHELGRLEPVNANSASPIAHHRWARRS